MGMACNVQMHAVLGGVLTRHFGLVAQQNMKLRLLRLGLLRHAHDIGGTPPPGLWLWAYAGSPTPASVKRLPRTCTVWA